MLRTDDPKNWTPEERAAQETEKARVRRNFWWIIGIMGLLGAILRPLMSHHG